MTLITRSSMLVVVALSAALGASACDRLLSADRRIERAAAAFETGDYSAAMNDVTTALEAEPDNARGRVLLARIALRLGDTASARKELDRAIEAGADPASLKDLHYEIFLQQGSYRDALIAAAADDQMDPLRRQIVIGTAQLALGQQAEAETTITQAYAQAPNDPDLWLLHARWLWSAGRLEEARKSLDELIAAMPDHAAARMYQGRLALGSGDAVAARESFRESLKTAKARLSVPEQLGIHSGIIESSLALGDTESADAALAALKAWAPEAFLTHYLSARVAYVKGDHRAAVGEAQRALNLSPGQPFARLLLGASLLAQGSLEQAESELSNLVADHPDNLEARKLLARLYLSRNDVAAARRVLSEAPAIDVPDAGTDWLTGTVLLVSGQTADAIARLEQGAAADPSNVPLRLDLARAYLMADRVADARALLRGLPAGAGGRMREQLTVLAEIAGKDAATARLHVARLVRENSSDAGLLLAAGAWQLSSGDSSAAVRTLEQAAAADPKSAEAALALGAARLQQGQLEVAAGHLQSALQLDSRLERAYMGLARIEMLQGDRDAARQWLERAISADPAVVESRLQLAELALVAGDKARMRALAGQALEVSRVRAGTLARIGELLMRASEHQEALTRFTEAYSLGNESAAVGAGLALVALGRLDEARARFEAASSKRPDWAAPVVYLAALDAGQRRFDRALARVATLEKAGAPQHAAEEIRGDVHRAAGEQRKAVDSYERANRQRPTSGLAIKLYRARLAAQLANPEASLIAWLERNPRDTLARTLLAERRQQVGDRAGAIAHYEQVIQVAANPAVENNLAWLYYEAGDGRAVALAKKAYDSAPENAAIADTYGWILVEKGRTQEGLAILERAIKAEPAQPEIQYHHAAALAKSGQQREAAAALRSLLRAPDPFPSRVAAENLLRSLPQ
ncbi:MAG: XrtA/PEP-CTERM system TPR-repeat protein PrsT [Steroidobacteraceae bacterium]